MSHGKYTSCIEACQSCAVTCGHCASECLNEENVRKLADCIATDIDCADACHLAVALMSRGSKFSEDACRFCADLCDACAAECEKHDHPHCRDCAEECRRCAEECGRMAA